MDLVHPERDEMLAVSADGFCSPCKEQDVSSVHTLSPDDLVHLVRNKMLAVFADLQPLIDLVHNVRNKMLAHSQIFIPDQPCSPCKEQEVSSIHKASALIGLHFVRDKIIAAHIYKFSALIDLAHHVG